MSLTDQSAYWNKVSHSKTFTHPLNIDLLRTFVTPESLIVDYGCGYGRVVKMLKEAGCNKVTGFDTSIELVRRGIAEGCCELHHFTTLAELPLEDGSVDCFLLFAVMTCIPENAAQMALMKTLFSKLRSGGVIYISDYYLQPNSTEFVTYDTLNGDPDNYGVFSLPEGATFRHHTHEWIKKLVGAFAVVVENAVPVSTMNGAKAEAFQMILKKL